MIANEGGHDWAEKAKQTYQSEQKLYEWPNQQLDAFIKRRNALVKSATSKAWKTMEDD